MSDDLGFRCRRAHGRAAVSLGLLCLTAQSPVRPTYNIYWESGPVPCGEKMSFGLAGPIISQYPWAFPACSVGGIAVSMCPANGRPGDPWSQGKPITITGSILSIQADAGVSALAEIGADGGYADAFNQVGGMGSVSHQTMLQAGTGIPKGGSPSTDHLDIYARCSSSTPNMIDVWATVFYTSP